MHIGIDARFYGPSHAGLGRYTKNLVDQLARIDTANTYTIFLHTSNFDEFSTDNPAFNKVKVPIAHYSLNEQLTLPKILSKYGVDLMHFPHLNVPLGYRGAFVVTIHDLIMHKFKNRAVTTKIKPIYEMKHLGYRAVTRRAAKKAARVIVPSQAVKDEIVDFYKLPSDRVVVTYEAADDAVNAVSGRQDGRTAGRLEREKGEGDEDVGYEIRDAVGDKRQKTNDLRRKTLGKYGITGKYIMYVGNVYPHKNIETLAMAMKELHHKYGLTLVLPSARSVFLQRTEEMMEEHGVREFVILPGYVPDEELTCLYQSAEAYVFPSLSEGFGLPPLEAMAAGLPVVCSDIPVLREVCGSAAKYFDPHSPDAIAKVVGRVVSDPAIQKAMRIAGHERVKQFSWRKMAEETLDVYEQTSGGKHLKAEG